MKIAGTLTFYAMEQKVRVSLVLANVFKITLADLDFMGQVKKIFAGKPFDSLYRRWQKNEL